MGNISKIDSFVVKQNDTLVTLIIGLVLFSSGIIMMFDHTGVPEEDLMLFVNLGSIFLIGGTIVIALCILTLKWNYNTTKGVGKT